jgi:hypothetical protein
VYTPDGPQSPESKDGDSPKGGVYSNQGGPKVPGHATTDEHAVKREIDRLKDDWWGWPDKPYGKGK